MRTLNPHEKRTIRIAGMLLAAYLVLFYGMQALKGLEAKRANYQKLVLNAQRVKQDFRRYQDRQQLIEDLREKYHLYPTNRSKATLVADASAAIQQAAASGQVQLGPLREASSRGSSKELASMQLEGVGPVPAITAFVHRVQTLGYPILIDSLQLSSEPAKPGVVKLSLTIIILDFDEWKLEEAQHA